MTSHPSRLSEDSARTGPLHRMTMAALLSWILMEAWVGGRLREARASRDRGDALAWAALAVGGVLLAAFVLAGVRNKSETIVNNICTNADPTTC